MTHHLPRAVQPPPSPNVLTISDSSLNMGLACVGSPGSGKTTLLTLLALQKLRNGIPQVLIDPLGTLTEAPLFLLLRSLQHVPAENDAVYWQKLRYIDVGNSERVTPFPIYYRRASEILREVAERFIETLLLANPRLVTQASVTWPSLRRVGVNTGMVLASLGYQLTEAEDLLSHPLEWEKQGLFDEAIRRNPEAAPAVAYFRDSYLPLSQSAKTQLTSSFLDHVFTFAHDPKLQLLFGASTPGLNLEEIEARGETVILDCRNITDPEARRFTLLWINQYIEEHMKARGRRKTAFGYMIDEFSELAQPVTDGVNPLAVRFSEFLQRYMRNHQIHFSCAFQSVMQLDPQVRNTIFGLGNIVVGRAAMMEEARMLADVLYHRDPYVVKHRRNVWMSGGNLYGRPLPPFIVDKVPEFMSLADQLELSAKKSTS